MNGFKTTINRPIGGRPQRALSIPLNGFNATGYRAGDSIAVLSIPLNGFLAKAVMVRDRGTCYAFNSIEWIHQGSVEENKGDGGAHLSIPLNGFTLTPSTKPSKSIAFQFH